MYKNYLHFKVVNIVQHYWYDFIGGLNVKINYALLGKRIALRRRALGLKQCETAERLDISNNYLSNIENNKSIPSLETFAAICDVLNTTPNYLLLGIMDSNDISKNVTDSLKLCNDQSLKIIYEIIQTFIANQN